MRPQGSGDDARRLDQAGRRAAEEDASCASRSAHQALETVEAYAVVVACELVAAVRALRLRGREMRAEFAPPSPPVADADLSADLELAQRLLPALA